MTSTILSIQVAAQQTNISIYNTGKNLPSNYQFSSGLASVVSGYAEVDCPSCAQDVLLTVWVSPLDVSYAYPSNKLVIGSILIPPGIGEVSYTFPVVIPAANVTYQIVGWDAAFLQVGALLTITNGIITDPIVIAGCKVFRGIIPQYGPLSSIGMSSLHPFHD